VRGPRVRLFTLRRLGPQSADSRAEIAIATIFVAAVSLASIAGCGDVEVVGAPEDPARAESGSGASGETVATGGAEGIDSRPAPMHQPIPLWEGGRATGEVDAATAREHGHVVIDLGEAWTPYLFTTRGTATETETPNAYRETYLALARGEFPRDHHGDRARDDKYLELYGIMPTISLLRSRMHHTNDLACARELDYEPLRQFEGFMVYEARESARTFARQLRILENQVAAMVRRQSVASRAELDETRLEERDRRRLVEHDRMIGRASVVRAAQARLECEGYFAGKGEHVDGALDWTTHEALAEFERRHRVLGWGFIGQGTLAMLRRPPMEGEQEAVIRVLTERAMHAAGVIEDGSVGDRHFRGEDGTEHDVPNLEAQVRSLVI
jgi:hypothetical protein